MGRECSTHGVKRNTYRTLVGKVRRIDITRRRRWEDNIKIDLREIGWGDMT
jgi:hypothetical protein